MKKRQLRLIFALGLLAAVFTTALLYQTHTLVAASIPTDALNVTVSQDIHQNFLMIFAGIFILFLSLILTMRFMAAGRNRMDEEEDKYHTILESLEDGYYEADLAGNLTAFNNALCRMFGYSGSELIGMNNRKLMDPESVSTAYKAFNQVFRSGKPAKEFNWKVRHKTGVMQYVNISISLIRGRDGKPTGFRGIIRDVTEKRLSEEKIRLSEEKFRLMAETSLDEIFQLNVNGMFVYVSPAVFDLSGYHPDEVIGAHFTKFVPESALPEILELFNEVVSEKKIIKSRELTLFKKNGDPADLELSAAPIIVSGKVIGVQGILRDVSERINARKALQESEEKYRLIFNSAPMGIFHYDLNGVITTCNPKSLEMIGAKEKQIIGMKIFEIPINESWKNCLRTSLEGRISVYEGEYTAYTSGKKFHTSAMAIPILSDQGAVLGGIAVTEDTSARVIAEAALRESQLNLKTMFDAITESIGMADANGVYLALNKTTAQRLGKTVDQMIGKPVFDFLPADVAKSRKAVFDEIIRTGEPVHFEDLRQGRHYSHSIYPVVDEKGKVSRVVAFSQDIHDAKLVEAELKKFKTISDQANCGAATIDLSGTVIYSNETFANLHGYRPDELIGKHVSVFHTEEQILHVNQIHEKMRKQNCASIDEVWHKRRDGFTFPMLMASFFVKNDKGEDVYMSTTAIDITEKKRIEQDLIKFKTISDQANYGASIINLEGYIDYANAMFASLHGYVPEELIGKHVSIYHTEEQMVRVNQLLKRLITEVGFTGEEVWHKKKDGSTFPTLMSAFILKNDKGENLFMTGTAIDITEKKKVEQDLIKFKTISDQANYGAILYDKNGNIEYLNHTFASLHGFHPDETVGKDISIFHTQDQMVQLKQLRKMMIREGGFSGIEVWHKKKDGSTFPMLMNAFSLKDRNGSILFMFATAIDITNQKKAEDELKASHEELRNLTKHLMSVREQERIKIGRELHDELGQVLTAINLEVSALSNKLPQTHQNLKSRAEAAAELAVGAIQSVKRIISELRPALIDDLGLAEAIKWQARDYQNRIGINFDVVIVPEDIFVDDDLSIAVFRIFQEAVTNAIRHSRATKMSVRLKQTDAGIELNIRDNGIGISKDQLSQNGSYGIKGMRERAETFGGTIDISGVPGKGTTLVAKFPV